MAKNMALRAYKEGLDRRSRHKRHRRRDSYSAAELLGLGIGIGIPAAEGAKAGNSLEEKASNAAANVSASMFGYNPQTRTFDPSLLPVFWVPAIAGVIVHKFANWSGINRQMGKMKVKL